MPEKETIERAREEARQGKSPSTQAGEFVREEMHHVREGKHGAASAPSDGRASAETTQSANRDYAKGQSRSPKPSAARSRARTPGHDRSCSPCACTTRCSAAGPGQAR